MGHDLPPCPWRSRLITGTTTAVIGAFAAPAADKVTGYAVTD